MIYFICIIHLHIFHGNIWTQNWPAPNVRGFITQLVERRTGIARSRVQAPLKSWIFFRLLYAIAKIAIITAWIILHLISYSHFTYDLFHMHHSPTYLSREHMNPKLTRSQRQWLHSSVGRASHRYREVTGSSPVEVLNFFQASLRNCKNCDHNCEGHSSFDFEMCICHFCPEFTHALWIFLVLRPPLFAHVSSLPYPPMKRYVFCIWMYPLNSLTVFNNHVT